MNQFLKSIVIAVTCFCVGWILMGVHQGERDSPEETPPSEERFTGPILRVMRWDGGSTDEFLLQVTGTWWSEPWIELQVSNDGENWQPVGVVRVVGGYAYVKDEPAAFFRERYYRAAPGVPAAWQLQLQR